MKTKKQKTIKKEIFMLIILISILPILLMGSLNLYSLINNTNKIIEDMIEKGTSSIQEILFSDYNNSIKDIEYFSLDENAKGVKENKNNEMKWFEKSLQGYVKTNDDTMFAYMGIENGKFITAPQNDLSGDYDPRSRDWYKNAINNPSQVAISNPYEDITTKKIVVTYSKAVVNDNGEVQGVVALDKNLDKLSDTVQEMNLGNKAHALVLSKNGTVIANKDRSLIGKSSNDLPWIGEVQSIGEDSSKTINIDGVKYFTYKATEGKSGLSMVILMPKNEMNNMIIKAMILPLIIFILIAVMASIFAKIFIDKLTKPISEVVRILNKIKDGDFTEKADSRANYNLEINSMVNGLNILIDDMIILLGGVKEASDKVNEGSETLFGIIKESSNVGEEVAKSVQQIAQGTTDQAAELDTGVRVVGLLEEEVNKSIEGSNKMLETSKEVKTSSTEGTVALRNLSATYEKNKEASDNIALKVDLLSSKSEEIGIIVDTIKLITEQTNLLALNASIEAARAGEVGRGFAVVAEEVRKLAEESARSAEEINNVIREVKGSIKELYDDTLTTKKLNNETEKSLVVTKDKFNIIDNMIRELEENINDVTLSLDKIKESKDTVVEKISEVAAVSQETAAITEEVSAASEEQSSGLQEMAQQSETLKDYSDILNRLIKKFKI